MTRRTVLIVDAQQINRWILRDLLSSEYRVLEAESGEAALSCLSAHAGEISAILLDIIMPEMDGYAVLRALADDPVLCKIPVIVSAPQEDTEAELRALALGAQDYFVKPYNAEIILHRLGNLIRLRETAAIVNRAERDELTGLYNKQFFLEKARQMLRAHPESGWDIICFNIEHFKLVNDIYGAAQGDGLLCHMAKVMKQACKPRGICGHFTADIFFALVPHFEDYSNDFFRPWVALVNEYPIDMEIRVYCGIYAIAEGTAETDQLMVLCDRARLAANKCRGQYDMLFARYDDSIRRRLLEEQFITGAMASALEDGQFCVYYQPKHDLTTESIAGAEALVRWIHPERGLISPGKFIPLFEKNGFITKLDRFVWETACRDLRAWIDGGSPPVAVSVNVSRADIYNPNLADILLDLVAKYTVPIRYLHLEITESAYTDNPEQIVAVVGRLRELGFVIEMDDFGSGYSSLNMLAQMPVDVLKLDMRFIQSGAQEDSGRGVLNFIISLARWLNLAVVAEGVETGEQIAYLQAMDCNYVQGFYFAKPMPEPEFLRLLQTSGTTEMVCTGQMADEYVAGLRPLRKLAEGREMLVVDDVELNRAVLAASFMDEYVVVERENGLSAWEYLKAHAADIDVVLLDLLMPVMDGFQLLSKIRSDPDTAEIPVVITAQSSTIGEKRAMELHADDFISKPYNQEIIRRRIHAVVTAAAQRRGMKDIAPDDEFSGNDESVRRYVRMLKPHFDVVRLVDPRHTLVYQEDCAGCDLRSCFSVWGKNARCNNCTSLRALRERARLSKLEYSEDGLFFVISEYVPYGKDGAVVEIVTRLDNLYVDNVFDKNLLYTNLNAINEQLEYDELTGVYNRRHIDLNLSRYIGEAQQYGRRIGLAMLDIDDFKQFNDTYGHLVGDEALRTVAKMLRDNIARNRGDFIARFGGDEFMIVCRGITQEVFTERVTAVAHLARFVTLEGGQRLNIGVSVGCANLSELPNGTSEDLVRLADQRLYRAKKAGRGRVISTDE